MHVTQAENSTSARPSTPFTAHPHQPITTPMETITKLPLVGFNIHQPAASSRTPLDLQFPQPRISTPGHQPPAPCLDRPENQVPILSSHPP
ncbi:hypothetical protein N7539_008224 [Penicillium diatomitis]|uniref:Uncharacterized protein n=1 Tax=Penicillium diatomitis TaxID=2819901 RepID=A0A9W9WTG3_9EURO|nr:uncharacterized protein N7539_008224 [Penicillium diatomitis]KAJ5475158.1 hypothetical protein N7539_008224 [Penicillium diatomitis]